MSAPHNNLPLQLSSFIGREREIAEVKRLLSTSRLLTLTGAGGCGKTALALHVCIDVAVQRLYADGVCSVELAPLANAALVPQVVVKALGIVEQPNRALSATLLDYLRDKALLLVLDNCEHLIEACAQLTTRLLQGCPDLRILATSREALNIAGEVVWIVPSLQIPNPKDQIPTSTLEQYDAIKLFVERALAVSSSFKLTEQNANTIVHICQQLDGIPLAIELAAARVKVLSVEQIAARLDDALRLLTEGKRSAPSRHQTLRATLDWSYDLLSASECALFRSLSVFAGGWTLEAAESVCADDVGAHGRAPLPKSDVLALLTQLVNKSLVLTEARDGEARYRMLEPIRQYARERVALASEWAALRARHLFYFHHWVLSMSPTLWTPEQLLYLANLERELDNFRAALEWALETQPVMALRIVWALTMLWNVRGYSSEGRRLGEAALKRTEMERSPEALHARALALTAVGFLTMTQGDNQSASEIGSQAVALLRTQNDKLALARALLVQGSAYFYSGQMALARAALEECLSIGREFDASLSLMILSQAYGLLAGMSFQAGDFSTARAYMDEALAHTRKVGSPVGIATTLGAMAQGEFLLGDFAAARQHAEESLALFRQIGDKHRINMIASGLANLLRLMGERREAAALYREVIHGWRDYGQIGGIARCIECLAFIAMAEKREVMAARWLGAAEALREASQMRMIPTEQVEYESEVTTLRTRMSPDIFEREWVQGRMLTMEQIIAEVEQASAMPEEKAHDPNTLTARELDVLRLLAQGLSDAQIAEKLVISRRTVSTHLTAIYGKLGVNSRAAATRYALDHKLV